MIDISWTITANDERRVIWSKFFSVFITLVIGAIFLHALIVIIFIVILYFGIKIIFVLGDKTYRISDDGFVIEHVRKTKQYRWNEFDTFAVYDKQQKNNSPNRDEESAPLVGEHTLANVSSEIYLHMRRSRWGIGKTFVVLETNTDNLSQIDALLLLKLQRIKMTNTSELGLIWYVR